MIPVVITQTQEDKLQSPLRENLSSDAFSGTLNNTTQMSLVMKAMVQKPLVQLTLDGPQMMTAPFSHNQKHNFKSGIRVKSHVRKARNATAPKKRKGEVPNNDPKLNESLRLAAKIKFDDLMRFREIVFCQKHK
jgi:hypothetical protein